MSSKRKQRSVTENGEEARRQWTVPKRRGTFRGIELAYFDPANGDDRRILIEAEHPEYQEALQSTDEILIGERSVNPHLHIAFNEVVATQLWNGIPPEVWETAKRLIRRGYHRHDIFHMLGSVATEEISSALRKGQPYDAASYKRALRALPESWERLREREDH